jgi:hypothetical protein
MKTIEANIETEDTWEGSERSRKSVDFKEVSTSHTRMSFDRVEELREEAKEHQPLGTFKPHLTFYQILLHPYVPTQPTAIKNHFSHFARLP